MHIPRHDHTATLLKNGKVLVIGGDVRGGLRTSAEFYDPLTESWTEIGNFNIKQQQQHIASVLTNGKVLVA
ncbi:unnamed protein product, partial [Rotaria sp. Silwood1]